VGSVMDDLRLLRHDLQDVACAVRVGGRAVAVRDRSPGPSATVAQASVPGSLAGTDAFTLSAADLRLDHEAESEGVPMLAVQAVAVDQPDRRVSHASSLGVLALHDVQDLGSDVQALSGHAVSVIGDQNVTAAGPGGVWPRLEAGPVP